MTKSLPGIHAIVLGEALPVNCNPDDRAFERRFVDGAALGRMLQLRPGTHARNGEWLLNMWESKTDRMTPEDFKKRRFEVVAYFAAQLDDPGRALCTLRERGAHVSVLCTTVNVASYLGEALGVSEKAIPTVLHGDPPYVHRWAQGGIWRIARISRRDIRYHPSKPDDSRASRAGIAARLFIGRRS